MPADGNNGIPGSQLSAVREFAGKQNDDVEIWAAHVDRCKTTFNWTNDQTAQIALNKVTESAAIWAEAQRSLGTTYGDWPTLKAAMIKRFKAEISDATAAMAMSELHQQTNESVSDFYDRCILAMKKKNHRVDAALKANADFKRAVNTDLFVYFGGGLKRHIRNATICSSSPPEDIDALVTAAKRVELQTESRDKLYLLDEAQSGKGKEEDDKIQRQIEALTDEVAALKKKPFQTSGYRVNYQQPRPLGSRPMTCWTCGKTGHFARNCYQNKMRGRGRGRALFTRRQGNKINEFQGDYEDVQSEEYWDAETNPEATQEN